MQSFVIRDGSRTLTFTGLRAAETHRRPDVASFISSSCRTGAALLTSPPSTQPPTVPGPPSPQNLWQQTGPGTYVTVRGTPQTDRVGDGVKRSAGGTSQPSKIARREDGPGCECMVMDRKMFYTSSVGKRTGVFE